MEWILAVIIVACVYLWKLKGTSAPATRFKKINSDVPTQQKKTDDFAGNSIGAFFFMEEFVDPAPRHAKPDSRQFFDDDYSDCDFIKDEFFD
uniref:hypothetical protein n=1 Tax=Candidatus Electrothrix sp. TaxID=2170559 RepID=UPI004056A446